MWPAQSTGDAASDVDGHAQRLSLSWLAGRPPVMAPMAQPPSRYGEAARAGVENVVGERDEHDVGADDAGHHRGVGDSEREPSAAACGYAKPSFRSA